MTWLLDLAEEHRAAVRYDLLRHGYRLEWLGTRRLPWGDAFAILVEQPRATSALFRAVDPQGYDRTREGQILELLAVLVAHTNVHLASGVPVVHIERQVRAKFPTMFDDLIDTKPKPAALTVSEDDIIAGMIELERFLGGG